MPAVTLPQPEAPAEGIAPEPGNTDQTKNESHDPDAAALAQDLGEQAARLGTQKTLETLANHQEFSPIFTGLEVTQETQDAVSEITSHMANGGEFDSKGRIIEAATRYDQESTQALRDIVQTITEQGDITEAQANQLINLISKHDKVRSLLKHTNLKPEKFWGENLKGITMLAALIAVGIYINPYMGALGTIPMIHRRLNITSSPEFQKAMENNDLKGKYKKDLERLYSSASMAMKQRLENLKDGEDITNVVQDIQDLIDQTEGQIRDNLDKVSMTIGKGPRKRILPPPPFGQQNLPKSLAA